MMSGCRNITISHENSITWMVMFFIKSLQLSITKIQNTFRISAAVKMIGVGRVQMFTNSLPKLTNNAAHGPFHFIVNNPFKL